MEGDIMHGKQRNDKDAVDRVKKMRDASISGRSVAIANTREVKRYVQHDPYTKEEKELAAQFNKPLLRYNLLVSKVMTLMGQEQANRRETKILADFSQNQEMADILQANWNYIREKEDLQRKRARAFVDGLLYSTGGWIRRVFERDDRGHLTYCYRLYDTLSVHPDKWFKEADLGDCNYICFDDWMTINQIRNTFGSDIFSNEEESAAWELLDSQISKDAFGSSMTDEYKRDDQYLVTQCEEVVREAAYLVKIDGQIMKLVSDELKQLDKEKTPYTVLDKTTDKRVHLTTVILGSEDVVLQDVDLTIPTKRLSAFYVGSYDFNMERSAIPSLGYLLLDPQDRVNKGKNQEVDYLTQTLSQVWHVQKRDKTAKTQLLNHRGEPLVVIETENIQRRPIKESSGGDTGAISIIQNSISQDGMYMDEVSNVTAAMQGKRGNSSESGVLFDSKLNQSQKSTNPFYEMIAAMDEYMTRDFLECVPYVYFEKDRELPVKIDTTGELGYEMVNLEIGDETIHDMRHFAGRAVLEDASSTPNQIEDAFNQNIAFAQMLINSGATIEEIPYDLIVKNSNMRDRDLWVKALQRAQQAVASRNAHAEAVNEFGQMADLAKMTAENTREGTGD